MKNSLTFGAIAAIAIITTPVFGQTVKTAKKAKWINLGDFSGNFTIGHNNSTKFDVVEKDKISATDVTLSTSFTLGLATYGGKVNYSLSTSYGIADGSTQLKTNQPSAAVSIKALKSDYGSVTLFGVYYIEFNDKSAFGSPGISYAAPGFSLGEVKFSPSLTLTTTIYGDKHFVDATVVNKDTGFEEEKVKVEQKDFDYNGSARLGASYAVAALPGLSLGSSIGYSQSYSPKYTIYNKSDAAEVNYESSGSSSATISFSYGLTDSMRLSSGLTYRAKDFFGEPRTGNSSRFVNSTKLSITMF